MDYRHVVCPAISGTAFRERSIGSTHNVVLLKSSEFRAYNSEDCHRLSQVDAKASRFKHCKSVRCITSGFVKCNLGVANPGDMIVLSIVDYMFPNPLVPLLLG